jgi:hypoxanthine phosphoribosyltransferase
MFKKQYISYNQLERHVLDIARQMMLDKWRPDYIVGITRGGLLPATLLSQYLDVPMETLKINLRDHTDTPGPESNCWMAEDAFGYVDERFRENGSPLSNPSKKKKILVVDDINDTGATLQWLMDDWPQGCLPNEPEWNAVWGDNVRFATIVNNEASDFQDVNYTSLVINKAVEDVWIVFPSEDWWKTL